MDPLSGPVNGQHIRLKHAAEVRQTETNFQVKFPRIDTVSHPSPEFRAIGIQKFRGNDCATIPIISIRNWIVEIPVETLFSREIVDVFGKTSTKFFRFFLKKLDIFILIEA